MTEQEQAPFDLAEGERLLAAYKQEAADPDDVSFDAHRRMHRVRHAWLTWLVDNGEALVTALKAAQKQYQIACDLVEQTEAERDAARVGLTRVEADYQNASQWHREAMAANERLQADLVRVERQAETDNEWLQARIVELEGSLRFYAENNGAGPGTARAMLDKPQTPAAS